METSAELVDSIIEEFKHAKNSDHGYPLTTNIRVMDENGTKTDFWENKINSWQKTPQFQEIHAIIPNSNKNSDLLLMSASFGDVESVINFLKNGADVNKANNREYSTLYMAVQQGYTKIVEILLEAGAKVNVITAEGVTPLLVAAENGYKNIVQALIMAGSNVNIAESTIGHTALLIAAQNGYAEITKALIKAGADIHKADNEGRTASKTMVKYTICPRRLT